MLSDYTHKLRSLLRLTIVLRITLIIWIIILLILTVPKFIFQPVIQTISEGSQATIDNELLSEKERAHGVDLGDDIDRPNTPDDYVVYEAATVTNAELASYDYQPVTNSMTELLSNEGFGLSTLAALDCLVFKVSGTHNYEYDDWYANVSFADGTFAVPVNIDGHHYVFAVTSNYKYPYVLYHNSQEVK